VHPERNVLTAAMGSESSTGDFSAEPVELLSGDVLLMCSDGLHGLVSDQEMLAITAAQAPTEVCKELVEMAKRRGGFDNITVQIVKIS